MVALKDLSMYLLLELYHCTVCILEKSGLDDLLGCGAQALKTCHTVLRSCDSS